ncbi:hypothetical protein [Shewanella colwelliana]|uniref:hypothetical protein n=1 Tax=Shewanella colwelliana TaxID=23 RepID=UPI00048CC17B|nr:hypothetical protein [Shewanella colwelliana]
MENGKPIFSKSLKKDLVKRQNEIRNSSLDSREDLLPALKERLRGGEDKRHSVLPFEKSVFFPVIFREALKGRYSIVTALYEEAIELHNLYMAGGRFPEDSFEWFNQPEISVLQQKLREEFAAIGKELAYKKRRKTTYEAQLFLFKNVLSPLDQFTWVNGCRLDFFFELSIDLLAQSFMSEFIQPHVKLPSPLDFYGATEIDYRSFCQSPTEGNVLAEQMGLYNLRDYIVAEACIKDVLSQIISSQIGLSDVKLLTERDSILFDIYELIPLYIKSWDSNKNKILINDELAIFLFMEYGFPSFAIGKPADKAESFSTTTFRFGWSVTNDFWCYAKQDCKLKELEVLGDFVLNEFHQKLLALYSIRQNERTKSTVVYDADSEIELADFTYEYHKSLGESALGNALESPVITKPAARPVPSVTMSYFFNFMKKAFECQVENGKGSEMKIWRKGTKIYTLGRHKQDQQIPSFLIKKILKRLGISQNEWLSVFIKRH